MSGGKMSVPRIVDPLALAKSSTMLSGAVPLTDFSRLTELLLDTAGAVVVELSFSQAGGRRVEIGGRIEAELALVCERCLNPMRLPTSSDFSLTLVFNDQDAKQLSQSGEEVVLVGAEGLDVMQVLEDELLLNLPMVVKHDVSQCAVQVPYDING